MLDLRGFLFSVGHGWSRFSAHYGSLMFHQNVVFHQKSTNMKASVVFYPNVSKKNARSGKYPIYIRVTFKRSKTENRINAEVGDSDLLRWDPMTMRLKERNNPVNHHLNRLEQFQDFISTNATQLSRFNSTDI